MHCLEWSSKKIYELERVIAGIPEVDFTHWTQSAELNAALGNENAARANIEHTLQTFSSHHFPHNSHFFTEVVVAALICDRFHLVYDLFRRRSLERFQADRNAHRVPAHCFQEQRYQPDFSSKADIAQASWTFKFEFCDNLVQNPHVMEWEVVDQTKSIFRFDKKIFKTDATHIIFVHWVWTYALFDRYHKSRFLTPGRTRITFGDVAASPGLAFSGNHPDVFLVPDAVFLSQTGYQESRRQIGNNRLPWGNRRPTAFWRGATTGICDGDWRALQRIRLCEISRTGDAASLFDVGISSVVQHNNSGWEAEITRAGYMRPYVAAKDFGKYKYQIDIDGNSSSWQGLFTKLITGSPVLKVESPFGFRQWYYDELKPWVNYVPVTGDMEDLVENLRWLLSHDDHAEIIGKRGRALGESLTYEREVERAVQVITSSIRFFGSRNVSG